MAAPCTLSGSRRNEREHGSMHVAAVIKRKGSNVVSIAPDKTIADATKLLTENRIGAALVLDGSQGILGIISERDIIRGLAKHGPDALDQKVTALMRRLARIHPMVGWAATLPLRWLPPLVDGVATALTSYPHYSICMVAYKPLGSTRA